MTLRVCSLYPELMNIYADRGNIAVLRARCEWRGLGFEHRSASLGRPVAVRDLGDRAAIDRVREVVASDGTRTVSDDVVELDRLDPDTLTAEAAAFGLRAEAPRRLDPTLDYVGSTVVMLRG